MTHELDQINLGSDQPQIRSMSDQINLRLAQPQTMSTIDQINHRPPDQPQTRSTSDEINVRPDQLQIDLRLAQPQTRSTIDQINLISDQPQNRSAEFHFSNPGIYLHLRKGMTKSLTYFCMHAKLKKSCKF